MGVTDSERLTKGSGLGIGHGGHVHAPLMTPPGQRGRGRPWQRGHQKGHVGRWGAADQADGCIHREGLARRLSWCPAQRGDLRWCFQ